MWTFAPAWSNTFRCDSAGLKMSFTLPFESAGQRPSPLLWAQLICSVVFLRSALSRGPSLEPPRYTAQIALLEPHPLGAVIFYRCEGFSCSLLQKSSWLQQTAWGCWPWPRPCAARSSTTWPRPSPCRTSPMWRDKTRSSASPQKTSLTTCPMTAWTPRPRSWFMRPSSSGSRRTQSIEYRWDQQRRSHVLVEEAALDLCLVYSI